MGVDSNDQYGAVNAILLRSGLMHYPVSWLATPASAMIAIIAADVWKTAPFVFVILLAGLQNVPQDLYDAIEIDGGGAWSKFRYVTWPHLLPFSFVALIFRIVQAFAIFDLVWVMTGGGPGGADRDRVDLHVSDLYEVSRFWLRRGFGDGHGGDSFGGGVRSLRRSGREV